VERALAPDPARVNDLAFLDEPAVYPGDAARAACEREMALPVPLKGTADYAELQALIDGKDRPQEAVLALPDAVVRRNELLGEVWVKLTERQRAFLLALRDNHFSERGAVKALQGTPFEVAREIVRRKWVPNDNYALCYKLLLSDDAQRAMDKDRLVLRAHEIAEEAMAPKPILYHGVPTGFYEYNGDVALRANEQVMKVAGHLKTAEAQRVRVRIVNLAGPDDDKLTAVEVDIGTPDFLE
jgi:hypothetical protein